MMKRFNYYCSQTSANPLSIYAAINIIPDYPPHGVYRGQHRGFSNISLQILPQERGISSFSGTERLKKHTNTLIIAT